MNLQNNDLSSWLKQIEDQNNSFSHGKHFIPRIVITEASSFVARSLIYRILYDEVFGTDQEIIINLYESQKKSTFLHSLIIEVTACAPNNLREINFSHEVSKVFEDADVVFSIGRARGYNFSEEILINDSFFEESVRTAKIHAEGIDRFAKKDVKVITVGNTEASIIHEYAKSIPYKNITSLSLILSRIAAAQVSAKFQLPSDEIGKVIPWGSNGKRFYPDFKFSTFKNGESVLAHTKKAWLKKNFPHIIQRAIQRSQYSKGVSYALADHCKMLLRGTPEDEWTCMGVLSDGSYGVSIGIFFTFPVHCKNGIYEIVKGLSVDDHMKRYTKKLMESIQAEVEAALHICSNLPNLVLS